MPSAGDIITAPSTASPTRPIAPARSRGASTFTFIATSLLQPALFSRRAALASFPIAVPCLLWTYQCETPGRVPDQSIDRNILAVVSPCQDRFERQGLGRQRSLLGWRASVHAATAS